jgi:hypothetical protein
MRSSILSSRSNRARTIVAFITLCIGATIDHAHADPAISDLAEKLIQSLTPLSSRGQLLRVSAAGEIVSIDDVVPIRALIVLRCVNDEAGVCRRIAFGPVLVDPSISSGEGVDLKAAASEIASLLHFAYSAVDLDAANEEARKLTTSLEPLGAPLAIEPMEFAGVLAGATPCVFELFATASFLASHAMAPKASEPSDALATEAQLIRAAQDQLHGRQQQIIDEATDLDALGASLLCEARRIATAREAGNAEPEAAVTEGAIIKPSPTVALSPTADPLGFVAWCVAVDGEQALLRARGNVTAADRRVRDLRASLKAIDAHIEVLHLDERVPAGSTGFRSLTFVQQFPLEAWSVACAVSKSLERRHQSVEKLLALAVSIAISSGLAPEAIAELTARIRQMEESLPPGFAMTKDFEATVEAHLGGRFAPQARQGIDVVQARTAAWELFAAAWNLRGVLPEQVLEQRGQQRSAATDQLMNAYAGAIGRVSLPTLSEDFRAAIEAELNSPFQACLMYPADPRSWAEIKTEIAAAAEYGAGEVENWFGYELTTDPDNLEDPSFLQMRDYTRADRVRRFNSNSSHQFMFHVIGSLMHHLDRGVARNSRAPRTNPFFADCNPYWSSRSGQPPLPRLTQRD